MMCSGIVWAVEMVGDIVGGGGDVVTEQQWHGNMCFRRWEQLTKILRKYIS
jgi:hypothetical protein